MFYTVLTLVQRTLQGQHQAPKMEEGELKGGKGINQYNKQATCTKN